MTDDFSSFGDDSFDDTPDWLMEDDDDSIPADADIEGAGDDDQFEQLRRQSARSGSMYDDMESDGDGESSGGSAFSWGSFSSGQRLVLAFLIVLDILAIGFGVMVLVGIV